MAAYNVKLRSRAALPIAVLESGQQGLSIARGECSATGALRSDGAWFCCAACNISLYYYAGFCYLLLRRYTDAARTFNIILNYISRWVTCPLPPLTAYLIHPDAQRQCRG